MSTTSPHHFRLSQTPQSDSTEGGYRQIATKTNFPALKNMAFYKLVLFSGGVRAPHWHANANELGYCLKGKVLVSFYGNKDHKEQFIVTEGQVFLIPSGALHSIENRGEENAELLLQFSHEQPEDFELSSTLGTFSDAVLGNTFDKESSYFKPLKRSPESNALITKLSSNSECCPNPLPSAALYTSPYKYDLEKSPPLVDIPEGTARASRQNLWPALEKQALYSLHLTGQGMREIHWHPETAELGYVAAGKARMSILSPSGTVDTYILEEGDIYFIPKAYPHHIENLTNSDMHFLIFFDVPQPQDIGLTGSMTSFPSPLLASALNSSLDFFAGLTTYYADRFLVTKKNPLDP